MTTELEIAKHQNEEHLRHMEDFERDVTRRVHEAKQEEWSKNHSLQVTLFVILTSVAYGVHDYGYIFNFAYN